MKKGIFFLILVIFIGITFFQKVNFLKIARADCTEGEYQLLGKAFNDADNDAILDAGEVGIPGVAISYNGATNLTSDANGDYNSGVLCNGSNIAQVTSYPSGYFPTKPLTARGNYLNGSVTTNFGFTQGAPTIPAPIGTGTQTCVLSNQPVIDLSWTIASNTTRYEVLRNGVSVGSNILISNFRDGTNSIDPLISNTTYTYQILATGNGGSSSEVFTATAPTCTTTLKVIEPTIHSGANFGFSGKQSTESPPGSDYFNPMNIALQTTPSSPVVTEFYVAFYDKTGLGSAYSNATTFMADVKGKLSTDSKNGFLIAFAKAVGGCPAPPSTSTSAYLPCMNADTHYVWDILNNRWQNIDVIPYDIAGFPICGFADCTNQPTFYRILTNGFSQWNIRFYQEFTSKDMYTAVFLRDSSGAPNLISNITPIP